MPRGRPKGNPLAPLGFRVGEPVKVSSQSQFDGFKLGLTTGICRYDGGIEVWLTGDSTPDQSVYACIQTERGDTIVSIEKK